MKTEKFKQIKSTHTYLKENNNKYTENIAIIAEEQTGGIGTKGRNWHTGSNKNIAMSMLFRPQKNVKNLEGLTIEIAKRIQKTMQENYNIRLNIKEPNDLMLNGKKICGILTESNTIGNKINYVIISIGFNVNEDKFPNELENIATSLYKETGKTKTQLEIESKKNGVPYDYRVFAINMPREILYDRINRRVDIMLEKGLIEEVKQLYKKYGDELRTSVQGIGYKEVIDYLNGMYSKEEMIEKIKMETRRYAKRQLTWFRKIPNIIWIDGLGNVQDNVNLILKEAELNEN